MDLKNNNDTKQFYREFTFTFNGNSYDHIGYIFRTVLNPILEDVNEFMFIDNNEYLDNLDDIMLRNAMNESLEMYNSVELKPNIHIDIDSKINKSDDASCSICQDDISINENIIHLECKHSYHSECIEKWVKYKAECPICRSKIKTYTSESD